METFIFFLLGFGLGLAFSLGTAVYITKAAEKERKLKRASRWK